MTKTILVAFSIIMGIGALILGWKAPMAPNAMTQWAVVTLFAVFAAGAGACAVIAHRDDLRTSAES